MALAFLHHVPKKQATLILLMSKIGGLFFSGTQCILCAVFVHKLCIVHIVNIFVLMVTDNFGVVYVCRLRAVIIYYIFIIVSFFSCAL